MSTLEQIVADLNWAGLIASAIRILVWIVAVWIAWTILKKLIHRFEKRIVTKTRTAGEPVTETEKRAETLAKLMKQGVSIGVAAVLILGVLREIGIDIGPILASAGVAGLAIGFGAQNLVRDVISGFFMLMENQVRVGDVAIVNGTGGLVEEVNFRTIVLRDLAGVVHVFPNGTINTLSNMTLDWSAYVIEVRVDYKEDPDKVIQIMRATAEKLKADEVLGRFILQPMEIFGVDDFQDSALIVKARFKTIPGKQWEVGREYRKRLKAALQDQGVEIPLPQRSLHFGERSQELAEKLLARKAPMA